MRALGRHRALPCESRLPRTVDPAARAGQPVPEGNGTLRKAWCRGYVCLVQGPELGLFGSISRSVARRFTAQMVVVLNFGSRATARPASFSSALSCISGLAQSLLMHIVVSCLCGRRECERCRSLQFLHGQSGWGDGVCPSTPNAVDVAWRLLWSWATSLCYSSKSNIAKRRVVACPVCRPSTFSASVRSAAK